jgi:hypothetical protein
VNCGRWARDLRCRHGGRQAGRQGRKFTLAFLSFSLSLSFFSFFSFFLSFSSLTAQAQTSQVNRGLGMPKLEVTYGKVKVMQGALLGHPFSIFCGFSKVKTPIHDSIRELITWESKEHGVKS